MISNKVSSPNSNQTNRNNLEKLIFLSLLMSYLNQAKNTENSHHTPIDLDLCFNPFAGCWLTSPALVIYTPRFQCILLVLMNPKGEHITLIKLLIYRLGIDS